MWFIFYGPAPQWTILHLVTHLLPSSVDKYYFCSFLLPSLPNVSLSQTSRAARKLFLSQRSNHEPRAVGWSDRTRTNWQVAHQTNVTNKLHLIPDAIELRACSMNKKPLYYSPSSSEMPQALGPPFPTSWTSVVLNLKAFVSSTAISSSSSSSDSSTSSATARSTWLEGPKNTGFRLRTWWANPELSFPAVLLDRRAFFKWAVKLFVLSIAIAEARRMFSFSINALPVTHIAVSSWWEFAATTSCHSETNSSSSVGSTIWSPLVFKFMQNMLKVLQD